MTKRAEKWPVIGWWWHHPRNIILGGLDIVTHKTKNKNRGRLQPRFKNHGCSHSPTPKEPVENLFYTEKENNIRPGIDVWTTFWWVNIIDCVIHGWPSAWIVIVRDFISHCLHSVVCNRRFLFTGSLTFQMNINFHMFRDETQKGFWGALRFYFFPRRLHHCFWRSKHDLIYHPKGIPWLTRDVIPYFSAPRRTLLAKLYTYQPKIKKLQRWTQYDIVVPGMT